MIYRTQRQPISCKRQLLTNTEARSQKLGLASLGRRVAFEELGTPWHAKGPLEDPVRLPPISLRIGSVAAVETPPADDTDFLRLWSMQMILAAVSSPTGCVRSECTTQNGPYITSNPSYIFYYKAYFIKRKNEDRYRSLTDFCSYQACSAWRDPAKRRPLPKARLQAMHGLPEERRLLLKKRWSHA